ncbi:MAG: TRAP transporter large permease subunit, partial [Spirochaetota bacterium]
MLTIVALDVILLVVLLIMSIPLPFCFGGALAFMAIFGGASMRSMMLWGFNQSISLILLASPLFILAGTLIGGSGVAKHLLNFVDIIVGRIKGGIGVVAVITCGIIGAISGSGFTGVAATGPILIPRMVEQGYPRGYATSLVTVSSILGLLIPPSIIMIFYGWVTDTSILAAFMS